MIRHRALRGDQSTPPSGLHYIDDIDYTMVNFPAGNSEHDDIKPVTKEGTRVEMTCNHESFRRRIRKVLSGEIG